MENKYFHFSLAVMLALGNSLAAQTTISQRQEAVGQLLSSSPTISFSNATGFDDNSAQDGEGGSVTISDIDIVTYPINNNAVKLTATPLQYHDGKESAWTGYPAIITYGDIPSHYGWVIKSTDGSNFSLESLSFLDWGNFDGATFVVNAFDNGTSKGTVTFKGNVTTDMVQLTSGGILTSIFKSVDEIRIYQQGGPNSYIALNNIKVSTSLVTSINEDFTLANLKLFPNPTEGLLTLELNSNAQVTITNALGNVVFNEILAEGKQTIDFGNEANGVYAIKVSAESKTSTMKFVKK